MSDKKKNSRDSGESDSPIEAYANLVSLMGRHDDVRIAFGQSIPAKGDPFVPKGPPQGSVQRQQVRLSVKESVAVTMSWQQAKVVRDLLGDAIKQFEDLNGEIKQNITPPS